MHSSGDRFKRLFERFEELPGVIERLSETGVLWGIGGSTALYADGHTRFPHDIDVILASDGHDRVDAAFGIRSKRLETDAYQARKSAPGKEPISFLSDYRIKVDGRSRLYELTPEMITVHDTPAGQLHVLRPEVIVVGKALLKRHDDRKDDIRDLLETAETRPLDRRYVAELACRLDAEDVVKGVLDSDEPR